jgi:hypothetical protein
MDNNRRTVMCGPVLVLFSNDADPDLVAECAQSLATMLLEEAAKGAAFESERVARLASGLPPREPFDDVDPKYLAITRAERNLVKAEAEVVRLHVVGGTA